METIEQMIQELLEMERQMEMDCAADTVRDYNICQEMSLDGFTEEDVGG